MEILHVSFQVQQPTNVPTEGWRNFPSFEEAQTFYVAYADSWCFCVKKRHHTHLFATDVRSADKSGNVIAGNFFI